VKSGVLYDIDKFIYTRLAGKRESHVVFYTRKVA
jgi:hypothetical protein